MDHRAIYSNGKCVTSGFPAAGRSRGVPVEYPDGCEVFIVYISDPTHNWEKAGLLKHQNVWKAETE